MELTSMQTAVAVIGMSCEFPGARDVSEFWRNIAGKVESVKLLSEAEAVALGASPENLSNPRFVRASSRVADLEYFDAAFFGYSAREAKLMDPQQRLLLAHAHHALEDAGYSPGKTEVHIGVFAGMGFSTYLLNFVLRSEEAAHSSGMEMLIANDRDYAATRVSYRLGLTGPSISLGTACSTSLVAIHLACRALLNYEADIALAGGIKLDLLHRAGHVHQAGGIFSSDGHTRTFDAAADGTTFGDGIGLVVLKRLQEALDDRDNIYAIVRGSAINNDGAAKVGYTAPGISGQADVIATAQAVAGVSADEIGYIEAHGTATPLGDPTEIAALVRAFRHTTRRRQFCAIGSVKSNIGHLDVAAGVAGFIKTVEALRHAQLPPTLNFTTANPEIDFENSPFFVNTELRPWDPGSARRLAGVSSFGVGGTNAHVILEEAPPVALRKHCRKSWTLQLSARTPTALRSACLNLAQHLSEQPSTDLADVAYTLRLGRNDFEYRAACACSSHEEAIEGLRQLSDRPATRSSSTRPVVHFMFPGQGSQHLDMARQVYDEERPFREKLDQCAEILRPVLELDLREVIFPPDAEREHARGLLGQTWFCQPAIVAIECALAHLWMSWGIVPRAMMGHSLGEYAAAHIAGVFSLEDVLRLLARRGRIIHALPRGSMAAVLLPAEEARPHLLPGVAIAAINSPRQCVLSGPDERIAEQLRVLEERGISTIRLGTTHAFHSEMMIPAVEPFREALATVELSEPRMRFVSNVTGTWITRTDATRRDYWVEHLLQPVRFADGVKQLTASGSSHLLEVGPGTTLTRIARDVVSGGDAAVVSSLGDGSRGDVSSLALARAVGELWEKGVEVDWKAFYSDERLGRIPLPKYPYQKKNFWVTPAAAGSSTPNSSTAAAIKAKDVGDWFYAPVWQQSVVPGRSADLANRCFLIYADDIGVATALAGKLPNAVLVHAGTEYKARDSREFEVSSADPADHARLIEHVMDTVPAPTDVIYLWSLRPPDAAPSVDWQHFERSPSRTVEGVLGVARTLQSIRGGPVRLMLVTTRAQAVLASEPVDPAVATLSPLATVINQESPGLRCRLLDLDPEELAPATAADRILAELGAQDAHPQVTYRLGSRWIRKFQRCVLPAVHSPGSVSEAGAYVITGGLGNVGFILARQLARSPGAKLVLLARSVLPPREEWPQILAQESPDDASVRVQSKLRKVLELESSHAQVTVLNADVRNEQDLALALRHVAKTHGPIRGIVHAAGEYAFASLGSMTSKELEACYGPKVAGVRNLAAAIRDLDVGFCMMVSSISSCLGGFGYAAYATANAYMDGFCQLMRAQGDLRWRTINWDAWAGENESEVAGPATTLMKNAIEPSEGAEAFARALASEMSPLVIATSDMARRHEQWVETAPALAANAPEARGEAVAGRNEIERRLLAVWQRLFGTRDIQPTDNFFEIGGDSLMGMSFVAELQKELDVNVYVRLLYEAPTVADQERYFREHYPEKAAELLGTESPKAALARLTFSGYLQFKEEVAPPRQFEPFTRTLDQRVVFVLSAPRSGSTLLRVMLGGHSALCAPPELELMCYPTLTHRMQAYGERDRYRNNGLLSLLRRACHCDEERARLIFNDLLESSPGIDQVYAKIVAWLHPRILVDKSPVYSHSLDVLKRADALFPNAHYIYLQRHPCGMIQSFKDARLNLLAGEHRYSAEHLAELQWNLANRSIREFLLGVPESRRHVMQFETLVQEPEAQMRAVCNFLGIEFENGMLEPYADADVRMTRREILVGDPKFHEHTGIDPQTASRWQASMRLESLGAFTIELARELGYHS